MNLSNLKKLVNNTIKEKEKELVKIETEREKIENFFDRIIFQNNKIYNPLIFLTILQSIYKETVKDINYNNLIENINLLKELNKQINERFEIYAKQKANQIEINEEYENELLEKLSKSIDNDVKDFLNKNFDEEIENEA